MFEKFRNNLAKTIKEVPKENRKDILMAVQENTTTYPDAEREHILNNPHSELSTIERTIEDSLPVLYSIQNRDRNLHSVNTKEEDRLKKIREISLENLKTPELFSADQYIDRLKLMIDENENKEWDDSKIGKIVRCSDVLAFTPEEIKEKIKFIQPASEPWYEPLKQKLGRAPYLPEILKEIHSQYPDLVFVDVDSLRGIQFNELNTHISEECKAKIEPSNNGKIYYSYIFPGSVFRNENAVWCQMGTSEKADSYDFRGIPLKDFSVVKLNLAVESEVFYVMLQK